MRRHWRFGFALLVRGPALAAPVALDVSAPVGST